MKGIYFSIPIKPQAWQRAGKFGKIHFTPKKTATFESTVSLFANQAMAEKGIEPFDEPLAVSVFFSYALPKSATKAQRKAVSDYGGIPKPTKPDIDNLIKAVLDGMNGVVYKDDACIYRLSATKTYEEKEEIFIVVETIQKKE